MLQSIPSLMIGRKPSIIHQVQKKTSPSSGNSANPSITLNKAPTSGNYLICCIVSDTTLASFAGWNQIKAAVDNTGTYMYYKVSNGTETTISPTLSSSDSCCLEVFEYSGLLFGLDQSASATGQGAGSAINTGTTGTVTATRELIIVLAGSGVPAVDVLSWNNGINIEDDIISTGSTVNIRLSTGSLISSTLSGTQTATATLNGIGSNDSGIIATFK
jgi:hypothetical protein